MEMTRGTQSENICASCVRATIRAPHRPPLDKYVICLNAPVEKKQYKRINIPPEAYRTITNLPLDIVVLEDGRTIHYMEDALKAIAATSAEPIRTSNLLHVQACKVVTPLSQTGTVVILDATPLESLLSSCRDLARTCLHEAD